MAYYGWYKPSTPKKVDNGIRAENKRGAFARQWWGKEWISRLERFNDSSRLARGRAYARKGQVTDLVVTSTGVSAKVQGSRKSPYKVILRLTPFSKEQWRRLIDMLIDKPIHLAQMLGGEMSESIEQLCNKEGLSLFPKSFRELEASCSCPDYANPCKHLAAVFYLLAEAFDRDPFLLFTLRGMDKEMLFKALGGNQDSVSEKKPKKKNLAESLPSDAEAFWSSGGDVMSALPRQQPTSSAILIKRLGAVPFWRSDRNFISEMEITCNMASERIVQVMLEYCQTDESDQDGSVSCLAVWDCEGRAAEKSGIVLSSTRTAPAKQLS
ncbi:MAG: SWIM zinc finger family protein [Chlorobium sp.]|jgi:uncharacterized Zn finger protein|nr:SWIM zinc finger family protein [Chlorobium sp.]